MAFTRFVAPFVLMAACISGAAAFAADKRETRSTEPFTSIGVSAPITVHVTQGDAYSLVIEGDEAVIAELENVVENGSLKLRQKTYSHVKGMGKVKAYVTARDLSALAISGSGDIIATTLRTGDVKLAISGSGDIKIATLTARKVVVSISGSGDVLVAGKGDSLDASIAGSGDLRARELEVGDAKVSIAGSGDAAISPRSNLTVSIVGSGDVNYVGDPAIRQSIIGSGSVRRVGAKSS
jgi:hypothetical protein